MRDEIQKKLGQLALKRSVPFCYGCYQEAPKGLCGTCGSDDLMRLLPEVGCEFGIDWIVRHILKTELEPVKLEEAFEESVRQCYPEETRVGWMTFDTVSLMKSHDPVSWRCALADYESEQEAEGSILSFDNGATYFSLDEIQAMLSAEGV